MREIPKGWCIESTRFHVPNMMRCESVKRIQWRTLIRSYLLSANTDLLPDLEEALNDFLGKDTIVMGDLNADVSHMGKTLEPAVDRLPITFQDGRPLR